MGSIFLHYFKIARNIDIIGLFLSNIRYIRVQGSNLRGGMDFQNRWGGPPKFWVLLHFYVTISKFFPILAFLRRVEGGDSEGGSSPPSPPMDTYGVVSISLWWANFFLGSSLTLKVENAFFSALYYSIITTVLWKKGRGQDSYFSTKSDEKINGLWKAQLDTSTFFVSK